MTLVGQERHKMTTIDLLVSQTCFLLVLQQTCVGSTIGKHSDWFALQNKEGLRALQEAPRRGSKHGLPGTLDKGGLLTFSNTPDSEGLLAIPLNTDIKGPLNLPNIDGLGFPIIPERDGLLTLSDIPIREHLLAFPNSEGLLPIIPNREGFPIIPDPSERGLLDLPDTSDKGRLLALSNKFDKEDPHTHILQTKAGFSAHSNTPDKGGLFTFGTTTDKKSLLTFPNKPNTRASLDTYSEEDEIVASEEPVDYLGEWEDEDEEEEDKESLPNKCNLTSAEGKSRATYRCKDGTEWSVGIERSDDGNCLYSRVVTNAAGKSETRKTTVNCADALEWMEDLLQYDTLGDIPDMFLFSPVSVDDTVNIPQIKTPFF